MPESDEDRLIRIQQRKIDRAEAARDAAKLVRQDAKTERDLKRKIDTRCGFLIGETIRNAELSHDERRVIAGILNRRTDKPNDWGKLSRWTNLPAAEPEELGEFRPSRPKVTG